MKAYDLIVVGAGPAGLMAAGQAAKLGARTLLLEKMSRPAIKLLLTGKGRCNLTNTAPIDEALNEFNRSGRFLTQLYYHFYQTQLREFFDDLGVPTVEERGGRIFPKSQKSHDVADALIGWVVGNGAELSTETKVTQLLIKGNQIQGLSTSQGDYSCNKLILATGGKAYPGTGSTGDGYAFARQAGHTIQPLFPALVPLITRGKIARSLQGLTLKNTSISIIIDDKKRDQLFGELLFTHFGLSGPVILTASNQIVRALENRSAVLISIDLKPALKEDMLDKRLLRDIENLGRKQFGTLLEGLLPKKLIPVCCDQVEISRQKKISQISGKERKRLLEWLKGGFQFEVVGHKGFGEAIITAGGVDTREINSSTMESKIISGLYFAGEIIDIHANTGGYNLQAAFSTGWAAGRAAAGS